MRRWTLHSALLAVVLGTMPIAATKPQTRSTNYGIVPAQFSSSTTPISVLLSDPQAHAILQRLAGRLLSDQNVPKSMTLADVQPFAPDVLTPQVLTTIDRELAKLPPSPAAVESARVAIAEIAKATIDPAAPWITHPDAFAADFAREPIALQFQREFRLPRRPSTFPVLVSAGNRFILFVNGRRAGEGPARGDLAHYRYEQIDIAPFLQTGTNVIAAQVWNDGRLAPVAEISSGHTGFMLKAAGPADPIVDTGPGWKARIDRSRRITPGREQIVAQVGPTYYAAGAPEQHDGAGQLDGWAVARIAGDWRAAVPAVTQSEKKRTLVPDRLPQMRYQLLQTGRVVRANGIEARAFPRGLTTVPAHREATLLVDLERVRAFYPQLLTSDGRGAQVTMTYAEALYDPAPRGEGDQAIRFSDRSRVDNGLALGLTDTFLPDGRRAKFEPYWWRAGRFVEIRIKTSDQPLTLRGLRIAETGYPFAVLGSFDSDDPELNQIWKVGWDTAQFDAHETYMDTAYWEQIQYVGDTRIQALVSYDVTGDPRLAIQALAAFDASRVIDGLPQSSWPISSANPIPPFALLWIGMLHDYWQRQPDTTVLRDHLDGMRSVLEWYQRYARANGLVRATPGWLFVDWRPGLDGGRDRSGAAPDSCVISLLRLGALKEAADIERSLGDAARAASDEREADRSRRGIQSMCWDPVRGLYADTPERTTFSQHANVLAVLYDVAPQDQRTKIFDRILVPGHGIDAPNGITGTTYYFSFYLARALEHAGMGDRYLDLLTTWRGLLTHHFTTWPENPDPTRSDSHAWSAHPTTGLLNYVAGIQPDAPGFRRVRIAPHLGRLTRIDAAMAHPLGVIRTNYSRARSRLRARVDIPSGLDGVFAYGGREWPLKAGTNLIEVELP